MAFNYLRVSGVKVTDIDATTTFTTDSFEITKNVRFSVSLESSAVVGGTPTYTVQVSNNRTSWYDYNSISTDVALADSIESDSFSFRFLRVVYTPNGVTAGAIAAGVNLKLQ